eukprot:scaffold17376_cov118-Isochrysis_galbana.AAC.6
MPQALWILLRNQRWHPQLVGRHQQSVRAADHSVKLVDHGSESFLHVAEKENARLGGQSTEEWHVQYNVTRSGRTGIRGVKELKIPV